jgi:glycosyltransferase involved in cell wall biosynthesis
MIANCLEPELYSTGRPFALEVVGDPYDVFAPGAVNHPMRPFFRWWFTRSLRRQCSHAAGVSYVTGRVLQKRYPCGAPSCGISDVELDEQAFVGKTSFTSHYSSLEMTDGDSVKAMCKILENCRRGSIRIVTVGSLEQPYKGVDVLIRAVAKCLDAGVHVRLTVVGDGRYRAPLEKLANDLGISESISLMGQLASKLQVRNALDDADLFVLASRTEGLPRAMLEAMARALPCIGTRVGGIPELLDGDDLVSPDDASGLASKICQVISDPRRMFQMSERNLKVSRDYSADILNAQRKRFFEHVRNVTQQWHQGQYQIKGSF